ncbi:hypothetical protein SUGI_0840060 [Cryptomeria japonica]|uniref:MLO-like protein 14 n=1 Tax=Cryptomeria japonica TaxID=3369 RepID=UPI002414BC4E|nr:MLO-like protein 14 [Cryptomeria japonica]GLJ40680.1 hypothetical protein SUGI_0840060 [Cryptomeria japonica]
MGEVEVRERSLALTPTWSVATVFTVFVALSLLVERSIYHLSQWLHKSKRKPLFEAVEKMKAELMLLGFISLMLTVTSSSITNFCIESKYYNTNFSPCTRSEVEGSEISNGSTSHGHKQLEYIVPSLSRRVLSSAMQNNCKHGYEPFVSFEGLEQLHRFIFIMAITHVFYSCLTMLLAIVKIYTWRQWENEAHFETYNSLTESTRELTMKRQITFVQFYTASSNSWSRNRFFVWVTCFFRQFGKSVTWADYLSLRFGFITNHNLTLKYDFHSYMIHSMEDEFKEIVGISAPLWGFVIAFMLCNVNGSNLYFWISIIPITLVLLVGAKLQHVIATLALENAGISESFVGTKLKPRDELFWFNRPELLLSLIHFILFQNAFELASFFWFWWQFGYDSCFLHHHLLVYIRLLLGFAGQFLCSYSTLPLYALVTQMGTNYKAALIPPRIRETLNGLGKAAKKKRRLNSVMDDQSAISFKRSTTQTSLESHQTICTDSYNGGFSNQIDGGDHSRNDQMEIEMQASSAAQIICPNSYNEGFSNQMDGGDHSRNDQMKIGMHENCAAQIICPKSCNEGSSNQIDVGNHPRNEQMEIEMQANSATSMAVTSGLNGDDSIPPNQNS